MKTATDKKQKRPRPVVNTGPGKTKQSFKDECDINYIMAKYQKTGLIDHVRQFQGNYQTNENIDFHGAMNMVREAQEMFLTLPSSVRKMFKNDPGSFLEFVHDPENAEKLSEMGLANADIPDLEILATIKEPENPAPTGSQDGQNQKSNEPSE